MPFTLTSPPSQSQIATPLFCRLKDIREGQKDIQKILEKQQLEAVENYAKAQEEHLKKIDAHRPLFKLSQVEDVKRQMLNESKKQLEVSERSTFCFIKRGAFTNMFGWYRVFGSNRLNCTTASTLRIRQRSLVIRKRRRRARPLTL